MTGRKKLLTLLESDPSLAERLLRVAEPFVPSTPLVVASMGFQVVRPLLVGRNHEALAVIALNRRLMVLGSTVLTIGSDGFTVVDPRQIFRWALLQGSSGAHAVIIAHNHPSQNCEPSLQDIDVTKRVAHAGAVLGIALMDHLVVTDDNFVSLAERGHLPNYGA